MSAEQIQLYIRPLIAIGGFTVWAYLMIQGRQLAPATTFALLCLILAMAGLGNLIGDITGHGSERDDDE